MSSDARRTRAVEMARRRRNRGILAQINGVSLSYMPAQPVRDHVNALMAIGWTPQAIVVTAGVGTMQGLRLIQRGCQPTAHPKWRAVLRMPLTLAVPLHTPNEVRVPMLGAQRRVQALLAMGYRHSDLIEHVGSETYRLATGRLSLTTARTWRAVDAAYRHLSTTPGPSATTRDRARAMGYAPPMAWDDIDNPTEQPKGIRRAA